MDEDTGYPLTRYASGGSKSTRTSYWETSTRSEDFSSSKPFLRDRQPSSFRVFQPHGWLFELLTLLLPAATLVVVIILLGIYQDKPSPNWNLGITLNTVVAILSNIFRSSLMLCIASAISQSGWIWYADGRRPLRDICLFDSASRGPLGSLQLLWHVRLLRAAGIGAFVTLLALAIEPCFQLTIKYNVESRIDSALDARTVTAYGYNGSTGYLAEYGNSDRLLPYNMQAAMYSGLLSSNAVTIPDPPFSCSTGNCTWDPFASLTVNAACTDISSHVYLNCSNIEIPTEDGNKTVSACNFASHSDSLLRAMLNGTASYMFYVGNTYLPRDSLAALVPYAQITGALTTVQWVRAKDILHSKARSMNRYCSGKDECYISAFVDPGTPVDAGRCLFYLSVNSIKVQITNGNYHEEVLAEYSEIPHSGPPTYKEGGTDFYFRDPWDWGNDLTHDLVYKPPFASDRNFSVTMIDFDSLSASIMNMLYSTRVSFSSSAGFDVFDYNGNYTANPLPRMLLQADNATRAMENMARYMTIALRSNDTQLLQTRTGNSSLFAPDQTVYGRALVQAQIVTVQWIWLIVPGTALVLTMFMLTFVIVNTQHHRLGTWKSSPLTLLLQSDAGKKLDAISRLKKGMDTYNDMEEAAKKIGATALRRPDGPFEMVIG